MEMNLPNGYSARPYRGARDHAEMARVLGAVRRAATDNEMPTADGFDSTYANFPPDDCVPTRDVALITSDEGTVVGYGRTARETHDGELPVVNWLCFPVIHPDHLDRDLFLATIASMERHLGTVQLGGPRPEWYLTFSPHPGPGLPAAGQSAWLESSGYEAFQFGATLVRPHLDDIAEHELPDGVEIRPVEPDHFRQIWEVHEEAFRGQWDFHEPDESDFRVFLDDPQRDESLWKIAWDDRGVVGQVKSFINAEENEAEGRRRGYTENISTRADRRGEGVAAALLCASLRALRDRGMTEAALGADVNNPAAFGLSQRLGFVVTSYEAVYHRRIGWHP